MQTISIILYNNSLSMTLKELQHKHKQTNEGLLMAISIKSTAGLHSNGVKVLVYGLSGAGKTSLIKTLPSPIILSAEGGLLSLSDSEIPYIEIGNMNDLKEAYEWLTQSQEAAQFLSVAIDSISEIGEVVLILKKKKQRIHAKLTALCKSKCKISSGNFVISHQKMFI